MMDFIKNFDEVAPLALGLTGQVNMAEQVYTPVRLGHTRNTGAEQHTGTE
jgi:hypothetical protein